MSVQCKTIAECSPDELHSPMNLYLYAVTVANGRLPPKQHAFMEALRRQGGDEYVHGYFMFLSRKTFWGRLKAFAGIDK